MSRTKHAADSGKKTRKQGRHAARPYLAAETLRTAACILDATHRSSGLTLESATSLVCDRLSNLRTGSNRTAVCRSLATAGNLDQRSVETVWDDAVADETTCGLLDSVVDSLTRASVDGERIAWAVIGAETVRHHRLLLSEANRMAAHYSEWNADDLVGFAWRGLRLALRSYDPNQALLSTFCVPRIRGSIKDGIRAEGHLPKRLVTLRNKVNEADRMLSEALDRRPTLTELAEAVDVDLERIKLMPRLEAPSSVDEMLGDDENVQREFVSTTTGPETSYESAARSEAIADAVAKLDDDAAEAVRLLVMEGRSFTQAQHATGVSARQLRSRRDRGLEQLTAYLSSWAA
ncbi:MAG: sigma-70 family RNA polymerase sigma factor [Actinomycetia bacterium]|nr:sigma-70 family RNA polymerase sigma factor [Actinomycetes bacterium]MCP4844876.1 sigma-70 family RNA polymerase sigma factor [Actinomycetes bacterium]